MSKLSLVVEALITIRPILAYNRAFKKPPSTPAPRPDQYLDVPGWRCFDTSAQAIAFTEAWFDRLTQKRLAEGRAQQSYNSNLPLTFRPRAV